MPSETNAMGSVSKQEEDAEKSDESVALMTLNSMSQESSTPVKHTNTHVTSVNRVSIADIRSKFFDSTGDDTISSTSNISVAKGDSFEAETSCSKDKTTGNANREFPGCFFGVSRESKLYFSF